MTTRSPSSLQFFYRRWYFLGHGAQLLAGLILMLAPLNAQYQPDGSGNPWWNSPDPEPSEGPDTSDYDSDNLPGWYESYLGTDPYNPDSDGDLITDGDEIFTTGTNPLHQDTNGNGWSDLVDYLLTTDPQGDYDSDGLSNEFEVNTSGTSPIESDTNNNGIGDYEEYYGPPTSDSDSDGIDDSSDPFPSDSSNYSSTNYIYWYGDVFGDADTDGILNWEDSEPYGPPTSDADGDGIDDSSDPFPSDSSNYSSTNYIYWYGDVFGDADTDGILNWEDSEPYGLPAGDSDGDGIQDSSDPYPYDSSNYSSTNGTSWYGDVLGDADSDGILNWDDSEPYGPPTSDSDGDSLDDVSDPFPYDSSNYSSANGISWYWDVLGDSDSDGILNWEDSEPYGPPISDSDGDGIEDSSDPFPYDSSNYSSANGTSWYGDVFGDADADGILNWEDSEPYGPPPDPDNDGDGLTLSEENFHGTSDEDVDSDDDGLTDYEEVNIYAGTGVSPTNAHSLSSEYTDWYMVDTYDRDGGGIPDRIEQFHGMNTRDPWDDIEGDLDGDGVKNITAYQQGWNLVGQYAARFDRDHDGMTDVWELAHGLDYNDPRDAYDDPDGDYLFNVEEYVHGTDPGVADTDGNAGNGDDFEFAFQITSASLGLNHTDIGNDGREYNDDWDGDGHNNRAEVIAGSDPRDGNSLPVVAGQPAGSAPTVAFPGSGGGSNQGSTPGGIPSVNALEAGAVKDFYLYQNLPPIAGYRDDLRWQIKGNMLEEQTDMSREIGGAITTTSSSVEKVTDPDGWWTGPGGVWWDYGPGSAGWVVLDAVHTNLHPFTIHGHNYGLSEEYFTTTFDDGMGGTGQSYYFRQGNGSSIPPEVLQNWEDYRKKVVTAAFVGRLYIDGGATKSVTKRYRVRRSISHYYSPTGGGSSGWVGDVQELHIPFGHEESEQTITLAPNNSDLAADPDRMAAYSAIEIENPHFTISATDGAGPRYRKIGLNGVPMPDDKPQVQDESGENPEETYVDAYSRQLRHSVSDVYASVESSLMPLALRRDATPEVLSERSGLRPSERPDRPFGMGWSSNVTPHIRFEGQTRAVVTDEQGSTSVFVRIPPGWVDDPLLGMQYVVRPWVHTRQERQHGKTRYDKFEELVDVNGVRTFKLTKKFGTTCLFSKVIFEQSIPQDRLIGSSSNTYYAYARLAEVQDRLGNRLVYTYPVDGNGNVLNTLIPHTITDPVRPAVRMSIEQDNGLITRVKGPSGEIITYTYGTEGAGVLAAPVLASVTRGGNTVEYGYDLASETDPTPDPEAPGPVPVMQHLGVSRITDERDNDYTFEYALNHSQTFVQKSGALWTRTQAGLPRLLTKVTLPNGAITNYGGTRNVGIDLSGAPLSNNSVQTTVSSPAGSYTYLFTEPDIFRPLLPDPGDENDTSQTLTLTFKNFSLTSAAGTESYVLNPTAGMALASATDMSGNTTEFFYADAWEGTEGQTGLFDDPTSQRNALLGVKTFTYDAGTRVLKSVTDERGTRTEYTIEPVTGLRTQERIIPPGGGTPLRVTDFEYGYVSSQPGAPYVAGFLTKRTVQSNTSAMGDMVTEFVADANGRVLDEIVQAGGGVELVTSYTYTGNGSKKTVKDPKGNVTTFEYEEDTLRLKKVIHPDDTFKELSYDAHGNVLWERDESGLKTFHEYDVLNRRLKTTVDLNGSGTPDARYTGGGTFNGADVVPTYNGDIVVETTYNAFNLPVTVTDARSIVTEHGYDAIGRRISTTVNSTAANVADKLITTYSYTGGNAGGSIFDVSGFKPTSTTDPRGFVTTVTYDDLYRPTLVTLTDTTYTPTSQVVTTGTEYDAVGNVISTTDPLGRETTTEYDGLNRPTVVHLPSGGGVAAATKQMFYTSAGPAWKSVDELGRDSLSFYDQAGRVIRVEGALVDDGSGNLVRPTARTAYDANGNVVAVEDALGRISETVYDNRNRPIEVKAPYVADAITSTWQRPTSTTVYDTMGRPISMTDPLGKVTETSYDRAGRATAVKRPAVEVFGQGVQATYTRSKYDAGGNVVETMDPRGRIVTNLYDAFSRLTRTTDALGYQTNFTYDKGGNRTQVKDAKNQATNFTYDAQNRVRTEVYAGSIGTVTNLYDQVNKTSRYDQMGRRTDYAYDVRNRLTTVTYVNGTQGTRSYGYDAAGQLLSVTESAQPEADVAYTYDALGRVSSEVSRAFIHEYTYDLGGNRIATTYGTGREEERVFDALNRPVSITESGRTTSYYYDLAGRAVGQLSGNGQWGTSHYDAQGRLVRRTLREGAGGTQPVLAELAFHHDAVGNLRQQEEWWPGEASRSGVRATMLAYDNGDRLRQELVNDGTVQTGTDYHYDQVGNRSLKVVRVNGAMQKQTTFSVNAGNQLMGWTESNGAGVVQRSAGMSYNNAGDRITQTITPAGGSGQLTSYAWDYDNRLTIVTLPDSSVHTYTYDYRMRRVTRSEPGGNPVAMTFSGGLSVAEYEVLDSQQNTLNSQPAVEYQRGPDMGGGVGGLLYSLRSGTAKFNLSNGRGDVVAQSDSTGALTWTASYEAYGKRPVETGSNADRQRANSKEEDPTGLLNEGWRYRDLETGTWLSRDPAGFVDGPNLYAYVRQNPWTAWDPLGLATEEERKAAAPEYAEQKKDYEIESQVEAAAAQRNFTGREDVYQHHKGLAESAKKNAEDMGHRAEILANANEGNYRQMMIDAYGINNPNLNEIAAFYADQFNDQATLNFLNNQRPADPPTLDVNTMVLSVIMPLVKFGGAPASVNTPTSKGPFVYRGLAKGEDPSKGITARAPGAGNSEISHIAGKKKSQWISSSKDKATAILKYGENGVVRIDLSKVQSNVSDMSRGFPNGGRMSNWAKRDQEVLIQDNVPPEALERIR